MVYPEFDATWPRLKQVLQLIMTTNDIPDGLWDTCYEEVRALCNPMHPQQARNTAMLYAATHNFLEEHVQALYDRAGRCTTSQELLMSYLRSWNAYRSGVCYMEWLMYSLNAQIVRQWHGFLYSAGVRFPRVGHVYAVGFEGSRSLQPYRSPTVTPLPPYDTRYPPAQNASYPPPPLPPLPPLPSPRNARYPPSDPSPRAARFRPHSHPAPPPQHNTSYPPPPPPLPPLPRLRPSHRRRPSPPPANDAIYHPTNSNTQLVPYRPTPYNTDPQQVVMYFTPRPYGTGEVRYYDNNDGYNGGYNGGYNSGDYTRLYLRSPSIMRPLRPTYYPETFGYLERLHNDNYNQALRSNTEIMPYSSPVPYNSFTNPRPYSVAASNMANYGISLPVQKIEQLALRMWKCKMIVPLRRRLVASILEEIEFIRINRSGNIPTRVLSEILRSFEYLETCIDEPLQLYKSMFEGDYLEATDNFFRQLSNRLLCATAGDCSRYVRSVLDLLYAEKTNGVWTIVPLRTHGKSDEIMKERLITDHLHFLFESSYDLVRSCSAFDLNRMWQVFRIADNTEVLRDQVEVCVRDDAISGVLAALRQDMELCEWFRVIYGMDLKYGKLVRQAFGEDARFVAVLNKSLSDAVKYIADANGDSSFPEVLANYCNNLLLDNDAQSDVEARLASVAAVVKYLPDDEEKNEYLSHYEKQLAHRLLNKLSHSVTVEANMVKLLQKMLCHGNTFKISCMLDDMTSPDVIGSGQRAGIECSLRVLRTAVWPLHPIATFSAPAALHTPMKEFEDLYRQLYKGRKLTWQHEISLVELEANFLNGVYTITAGVFEISVLLLFNDRDEISMGDVMEKTKLPEHVVCGIVQRLVEAELLIKNTSDSVQLNVDYANENSELVLPRAEYSSASEQPTTPKPQTAAVDPKSYLACKITRIMKTEKEMEHKKLVVEVIKQSRFVPTLSQIKHNIEYLIDQGYLSRKEDETDGYCYEP